MKQWLYCHSLSIVLAIAYAVTTWASYIVEHGTWLYDFWMNWSGGFGVTLIFTIASKYTWEQDADPTKEPNL